MAKIRGTQTEKNLLATFAGESQAQTRYTFFAGVARKEGMEQIANIFIDTANNEREHAKIFFQYLDGGDVEIMATFPSGGIKDTKTNLEAAIAGENLEWTKLYLGYAQAAQVEGFVDIATSFDQVIKVEKFHENRFKKLLANVTNDGVFKKKILVQWHCINCGLIYEGIEPPKECSSCKFPQAFFEVLAENY